MLTPFAVWLIYIAVVVLVFLIGYYLFPQHGAISLLVALLLGLVVVFFIPKPVEGFGDTASYAVLAGLASFLLVAVFVWAIIIPAVFRPSTLVILS